MLQGCLKNVGTDGEDKTTAGQWKSTEERAEALALGSASNNQIPSPLWMNSVPTQWQGRRDGEITITGFAADRVADESSSSLCTECLA